MHRAPEAEMSVMGRLISGRSSLGAPEKPCQWCGAWAVFWKQWASPRGSEEGEAWGGTAGPSLATSSETRALPQPAMSSPPVFLGVRHTWGPLRAGAGILGKTMAPAGPAGMRVPHAAGTGAHGRQAPATGLARG